MTPPADAPRPRSSPPPADLPDPSLPFPGPAGTGRSWPDTLDLQGLAAEGFAPRPFRQVVLKLTGRCDLACDYCYMFEKHDQSWRTRPRRMTRQVVEATAARILEHALAHDLPRVEVVLHGGEPLLLGPAGLDEVLTVLRTGVAGTAHARGRVALDVQLVTNAVLLDAATLRVLDRHSVRVAVSVDGPAEAHDRHRRFADGRGSSAEVARGLQLLTEGHRRLFAGVVAVVDLRNDPVATYEALLEHRPPVIDLSLPHATWADPPERPADARHHGPTAYGDWLAAVFDRWYPRARSEATVRILHELVTLCVGGRSASEAVGLSPAAVVTVNTDGTLEHVDTLRVAGALAHRTGLRVQRDAFDAALWHPGTVARQLGVQALSPTCRGCAVHEVCGGGYYPHRYSAGGGFLNPSVYCHDLGRLVGHVQRRVQADLAVLRATHAHREAR